MDNGKRVKQWTSLLLLFGLWLGPALSTWGNPSPQDKMIQIFTKQKDEGIHFYIRNLQAADVTVTLELELENLQSETEFPFVTSVPGKTTQEAFVLTQTENSSGWRWRYTYFSTWGNMKAEHNDSYVYRLPYLPGTLHRVSQGHNSEYSHFGSDQFAIDWKMPPGTRVLAARGGIVAAAKDDSTLGGPDKKFDWDANYILIKHSDGTYGHYAHLHPDGNQVKVGDKVRAGQWIALSGNTGHSTGPHLHFAVFKGKTGKERQSIPVRFKTEEGFALMLEEGKSYRAPGRALTQKPLLGLF